MNALPAIPSTCRSYAHGAELTIFEHPSARVHRLALTHASPLYLVSLGHVETFTRPRARDTHRFNLPNGGVFELCCRGITYVHSVRGHIELVTELDAIRLLGGRERLLEWGLDDAAISLEMGDLTNARCQFIRARELRNA